MKSLLLATVLIVTSTSAFAETVNANIQDHYKSVVRNVPTTESVCETIDVPIYGTVRRESSTADTVVGALIGGALGNQVGGGSGKDAATVLGAIIGADVANRKGRSEEVITGYRQQTQCKDVTTYARVEDEKYSHSTIRFKSDGRWVTLKFQR